MPQFLTRYMYDTHGMTVMFKRQTELVVLGQVVSIVPIWHQVFMQTHFLVAKWYYRVISFFSFRFYLSESTFLY